MKSSYKIKSESLTLEFKSACLSEKDSGSCTDKYEILYITSGLGRLYVEGSCFPVVKGTLMLIRPYEHRKFISEDDSVIEYYSLTFAKSALSLDAKRVFDRMLDENSGSGNYYSPSAVSDMVISTFDRLERGADIAERDRDLFYRFVLYEMLIVISSMSYEKIQKTDDDIGTTVMRYINANITRDLNLDRLSKYFFVSKFYLCRAFKQKNGVTVHSYITEKRVTYAKELIDAGETASSAAYRVGFGDYSSFYRAYVKIIGEPPTTPKKKKHGSGDL